MRSKSFDTQDVREKRAEARVRLVKARGSAELREVASGSATLSL